MGKNKKQSNKWMILILLLTILIIISGVCLGFYYSLLPENNPQRDKESCESIYGKWLDNENRCLLSYKKAGEECTDGGQCESGVCFPPDLTAEQNRILTTKPIENITGTCYPENLVFGCVKQVNRGTISKKSMCLQN